MSLIINGFGRDKCLTARGNILAGGIILLERYAPSGVVISVMSVDPEPWNDSSEGISADAAIELAIGAAGGFRNWIVLSLRFLKADPPMMKFLMWSRFGNSE
jgi:hypothetical protein